MSPVNLELVDLLAKAGCPSVAAPDFDWSRLMVVRNTARLPPGGTHADDADWNRGFNLVLLDTRGRPTHYIKARPAGVGNVARETRILTALQSVAELRTTVPAITASNSARVQLQVLPFLKGATFEEVTDELGPVAWERAVGGILAAADRIAAHAGACCPDLASSQDLISVEAELAPSFDHAVRMGLSPDDVEPLAKATAAAGLVAPHLQHGDLWPANVLQGADGWRILDFEHYGAIQVPLYDVLHLVRFAPGMRRVVLAGTWVQAMVGEPDAWITLSRTIIRSAAKRRHLSGDFVVGALAFYLVSMSLSLHRRGNPTHVWERVLNEARILAALLRADPDRVARQFG